MNTLEVTFLAQSWWKLAKMIVLMKSRSSLKVGHVGSKTRSLGQILEKPCEHSRIQTGAFSLPGRRMPKKCGRKIWSSTFHVLYRVYGLILVVGLMYKLQNRSCVTHWYAFYCVFWDLLYVVEGMMTWGVYTSAGFCLHRKHMVVAQMRCCGKTESVMMP